MNDNGICAFLLQDTVYHQMTKTGTESQNYVTTLSTQWQVTLKIMQIFVKQYSNYSLHCSLSSLRNSQTWLPSNLNIHLFMLHQVSSSHSINIMCWMWLSEKVSPHSNMQHRCSFVLEWHHQIHSVKQQTLKLIVVPWKPQCVHFESSFGSSWWYYQKE